jgi:hypothetical protein
MLIVDLDSNLWIDSFILFHNFFTFYNFSCISNEINNYNHFMLVISLSIFYPKIFNPGIFGTTFFTTLKK